MPRSQPAEVHVRTGLDIVQVARVERLLAENPGADERIFTERELSYSRGNGRSAEHLAARFAGKEAVLKALGGPSGLDLREIEIVGDDTGRPQVRLSGGAREVAARIGVIELDVSLSHSGGLAVAHAVALQRGPIRP